MIYVALLGSAMSCLVRKRRAQPVDATPSDMNSFSKGGVYGTRKTEWAVH